MGRLRRRVTAVAVLAGTAALVYRFGLSDEARDKLKEAARSVRDSYERINEVLGGGADVVDDPENLPNRRATEAQWESLGF